MKTDDANSEGADPLEISSAVDGGESISESNGADSDAKQDSLVEENGDGKTFSYERLKSKSSKPVTGIDYKRREVCNLMVFLILCNHTVK